MIAAVTLSEAFEYTIDQLAAVSGVPSRTIRFYQSAGALPGPEIRGRIAYYGEPHVERLKLIASLQDRGLRIKAIRDLLERSDKGELHVGDWLGLQDQLAAPWAADRSRVVTESELRELIGDKRPGLVADLVRIGLIERQTDGFLVRSPSLLDVALRLERAGIDLETAAEATGILRKHLARAAADVTDLFFEFGKEGPPERLRAAFEELRPASLEVVRILFAQEVDRALRKLTESGATTKLARKKK
jgi:DNA-binding transcriptional MerR regulator